MINKLNILRFFLGIIFVILPNGLVIAEDNGVSVFMYHRVGDHRYPSTNVSIEQLKSQIFEVKKDHYNILKASDVVRHIAEGIEFKKNSVAFTIDDAYVSFYENGWPLFRDNDIPATLFVSTDMTDFSIPGYMSWDQIRKYINEGGIIGQHTASHMSLPFNNVKNIEEDILRSQKRFMEELGFVPDLFAFPFGEASEDVVNIIKDLNIKSAFGQHSGPISHKSNIHYMPRFSINENFGDIERFTFSSSLKPLIINNLKPSDMFITNSKLLNFGFEVENKKLIDGLQCFGNLSGEWTSIDLVKNESSILFSEQTTYKEGRRRINCTSKFNGEWYWFGHQILIK